MAKTRSDWVEAGLQCIADSGIPALTIESLTEQLGMTRGSFYHHFANWQTYKEQLLQHYEQEKMRQIQENADLSLPPRERLKLIAQATLELGSALEVEIRAWAWQDPLARVYQERIDMHRLEYLEAQFLLICHHHERSKTLARLFYSIYLGSQHLLPPVQGVELHALYRELTSICDFWSLED